MKRVIIIMILITILASVITAGLIVNKKMKYYIGNEARGLDIKDGTDKSTGKVVLYTEYHLPINDGIKGASTSQTFDINPLKFTENIYEDEKTYAMYLQIDGLKDENIEKQINDRLKEEIIEFGRYAYDVIEEKLNNGEEYYGLRKYSKKEQIYKENDNRKWNSCVKETILFNGNNILSIALTDISDTYLNRYSNRVIKFLNYNLTNGKEIRIEELFTKEYSVSDAVFKALYYQLGEGDIKWTEEYHYNEVTGEKEWWRKRWIV